MRDVYQRNGKNWLKELQKDELVESEDKGKMVTLVGLRRLAHMAGYNGSSIRFQCIKTKNGSVIFQCFFAARFDDGSSWEASADSSSFNTDNEYFRYPTAMAESRAEARALKRALAINMLSYEEVAGNESELVDPDQKIDPQVVSMIQIIMERKELSIDEVLKSSLSENRISEIEGELKKLTYSEGQKIMSFLNKG